MLKKLSLLLFVFMALAGCDSQTVYDKALNEFAAHYANEVELSKKYLALVQAHDFAPVEDKLDPRIKNDQLHSNLEKVAAFFPAETPISSKLIGLERHVLNNNGETSTTTSVTFEDEFSGKWLQASVVLLEKNNMIVIAGLNVLPLPDSLENLYKFKFTGQTPIHYVVAAASIIVPLFILTALIFCIRTPIAKKKWLWILFILFGFANIHFNWANGVFQITPLYLTLFGGGFSTTGPYSPVILNVSVPLGAIVFFFKRKKWAKATKANP